MERKLRFLEKEMKKDEIPCLDTGDSPEAPQPRGSSACFLIFQPQPCVLREMVDLEATFEKLEHELREVNQNAEALKKNFLELTELKHILRKTQQFFDEQEGLEQEVTLLSPSLHSSSLCRWLGQGISFCLMRRGQVGQGDSS